MQFITTDQRIAVENFQIGLIYTVTFTGGRYFSGACIGKGADFVMFQRTAPELVYCLNMAAAADVASIEPLGSDIGKILEYTGSVPVSIKTNGSPLLAYTIKGNELPGTGDKTANLFDYATQAEDLEHHTAKQNFYLNSSGGEQALTSWWISDYIEINADTVTVCQVGGNTPAICCYDSNKEYIRGQAYMTGGAQVLDNITLDTSGAKYVRFSFYRPVSGGILMLVEGSTAPSSYIPYGYKIPILSGDTTTNIYLDNPLRKSLDGTAVDELSSNGKLTQRVDTDGSVLSTPIISYIDTLTIPTNDGLNIFDIESTIKPSEVYIKYFSPLL